MPMPSFKDVANKQVENSTKLARGFWSIKPITLNVSPGNKVFLENIMLNDPEPPCLKDFQETFKDKYVCIFMLPVSSGHAKSTFLDAMMLRDVYKHIESSGGKFKVICVPTHPQVEQKNQFNYDEYFNPYPHHMHIISRTPFSHIPIDNNACLERISRTIGLPKYPQTTHVIIGPMKGSCRRVVSIFDSDFLNWYGAEAYPFTTEKIQQLASEDEALRNGKHDLRILFSTPGRDFVISNDCTKVPISDLQHKTVCVLFYENHWECRKWTEELKQVYEAGKNFEVVIVFAMNFGRDPRYLLEEFKDSRPELMFWKVFHDMPWLAIPYEDPKCRQLWRVFNRTEMCSDFCAPKLLIIDSEENYFEENGFQILEKTRFKIFPFLGKEVGQAPRAAGRGKTLSSILGRDVELLRDEVLYGRDWEYGGAGQEIYTVSELLGAPVGFLLVGVPGFSEFLSKLHNYHSLTCQTTSKSEVIYVPMTESSPNVCTWMLGGPSARSNKEHLVPLFTHYFKDEIIQNPEKEKKFTLALVTFGPFGHYFSQGIIYTNNYEGAYQLFLETFPFMDNAEKEFFKLP